VPTAVEIFAGAFQSFQAGNLRQAEDILQQLLLAAPAHCDAHHLQGIIAYQTGRHEQAVASMSNALRLNPSAADCHTNLGLALEALGRMDEAFTHFQHALRIQPNSCEAHTCMGNALLRQQKPLEAMEHFRRALQTNPSWAPAHNGRGLVLEQQNELDEAKNCYEHAVQLKPNFAEAHYNLGNVFKRQGKLDEAIHSYQVALKLKPNLAEAHNNMGGALSLQGKYEDAIGWFGAALRINPKLADAFSGMGHAYEKLNRPEESIEHYRAALRIKPDSAEAHIGLGCALQRLDQIEDAIACFEEALRLDPTLAEAHNNLGTALECQEKLDDALTSYQKAMSLKPGYAAALWNQARHYLLLGEFEKGWPDYERRLTQCCTAPRTFAQPLWDGSDLAGQTIVLYAEQGFGDTLLFIRYAPLVKQRGGTVIVECQPQLTRLLGSLGGIDFLLSSGDPLPRMDMQAPLGSLPAIFNTTLSTIPAAVPYLFADQALVEHWRKRLMLLGGFKVGIAWQGNPAYAADRQRSIPLKYFAPLAAVEGVQLISLQKWQGADQLETIASMFPVVELGAIDEASGAFMDTAAIMRNLDLVVCSDSAVAHLAGALGVPVWLALPVIPDWRWLLKREDSPWYPTMRLFRQIRDQRWPGVFDRLADALARRVAMR
jgi:tetratricopeptide (TPR) repeat protein